MNVSGPNIGGAWQYHGEPGGMLCTEEKEFDGYRATITTSYYCHCVKHYQLQFNFDCGPYHKSLCNKAHEAELHDDEWVYNRSFNVTCPKYREVSRSL